VTRKTFTLPIAIISLLLVFGLATDYASANPSVYAPYITIQADGTIEPPTDQISRSGNTYTLTGNLTKIAVQILCSNIVFDGVGYNILGGVESTYDISSNAGLRLESVSNVIIKNVQVYGFAEGITFDECINCSLLGVGADPLILRNSDFNTIAKSTIGHMNICFLLQNSSNNLIYSNNIGTIHMVAVSGVNSWDNDSLGNYWGDYTGVDSNSDGIGDTPCVIDSNNIDNYPLMKTVTTQETPSSPSQGERLELSPALLVEVSIVFLVVLGIPGGILFYRKKQRRNENHV
jgi:hypothetical protein